MPKGKKAAKPEMNFINISTVYDDIMTSFNRALYDIGFNNSGVDESIPNKPRYITHNQINYCLRMVARDLFTPAPGQTLYNNQKSLIDYDNNDLLQVLATAFIDICSKYNKSLGLVSFSWLCNIDLSTLYEWVKDSNKLNPKRSEIIKTIQETHKAIHIGLLNDSPVGAMATANNDQETGLNWSANQAQQITNNTVYYLPSERSGRLNLEKAPD